MQVRIAIALLKNRQVQTVLIAAVLLVVMLPVIVAAGVAGLFSQEAESACGGGVVNVPAGGGPLAAGLYAAPLELAPGRWYEVGATEYGGPGDPTSGSYGAIPNPGESYLPAHPDSFAELSVLDSNPANGGGFTFQDANALDHLPYLATLRVAHAGHESLLRKRDVGYGQGPGQLIANGQPYRLDVWWQAARPLQITKSSVKVALAPATGAAGTLAALPESHEATGGGETGESCPAVEGGGSVPLPLTPGTQTKILPSGLAAAGAQAPRVVKNMVAAGNRLFTARYLYGGAHGPSLDTLQPAYDCSSAVSYVLHAGGGLGTSALDSTGLESYGQSGPGQYVSIYANAGHAFMYVGGLRFDTVEAPEYDTGPNSGKPGPRWRVFPTVPSWATWTVRHPPGL
ncbi:MAG TPA: hypothetical protein VGY76_12065 [Solirubrobacteraceae bacterium]|jgi:hypothetical protein|nr:hypothetical protein [Solirubrobacteraceae bacterium]